MIESKPIEGRTAVVTGASSGIGRAIAEHLGGAGALDTLAGNMKQLLGRPNDVARAVLFAVIQPIDVNIADIVVRPPKSMTVPH